MICLLSSFYKGHKRGNGNISSIKALAEMLQTNSLIDL